MKGMKTLALALMAMAAMESEKNEVFRAVEPKIRMRFNPNHKPVRKYLHEFSINGEKVMAYSRKDAITRLRHKK